MQTSCHSVAMTDLSDDRGGGSRKKGDEGNGNQLVTASEPGAKGRNQS